ncbi:MAG TPA: PIG-L family deacetylase [Tetrasphaera sp.]|uniref:PIG-L deacetylase family protein n=1 Tax=Nostocoides sp. TaxID=1917966 RepID=UPI002C2B41A7|nr:PIG-L family deacetylase [Tetrasphaera sp.]HNQ07894.1 PIG-L family deacetylase [Tetrasphaera sp.]
MRGSASVPKRTVVAFHAHPDDEALLTAGTMAKAAAQGHRVVLALATDGGQGLAASDFHDGPGLGSRRLDEARASAAALGVARVVWLGYADSGMGGSVPPPTGDRVPFVAAPLDEAARRLASLLAEERADVLLSYDARGGYGHRDHVRVHEVGAAAAALSGTPVLEATIPRDLLAAAVRASARVYRYPPEFDIHAFTTAYSPRRDITHRIDVIRYAAAKRASMRAHASQASADGADRTLAAFLRIPRPAYDLIFGREWFRDPALPLAAPIRRGIFAGLG